MANRSLLLSLLILLSLSISVFSHGGSHDHDDGDADAASDGHDLRSRPLILVKIWCLIIVLVGTFAGGVSPYFFKWNEGFLLLGTQFAGGVFLGTALMHFLSDSAGTFGDLTDVEYPFAFMLACAGYLMTMMADCVISHVYAKSGSGRDVENGGSVQQSKVSGNGGYSQSHGQVNDGRETQFIKPLPTVGSFGDSVLLIVALCFHSVFEGIAIGVAETKGDAWKALWTVCLHKIFAAIAMGIALLRMIPGRPFLSCAAYAFAFAISSPVGVVIGIVIDATTQGAVADWIYAISMGIATGVFVYVSINHLLSKGFTPQRPVVVDAPFYKFLAVTLGIGVIAVVMIWDT
ncbi:zinc transporter 2-like isoform X2 [Magnolia sinica]|uniref:zinc transporter 2-like isoform X2 n=1 Tax=Magnolia sinica TaxID=86752 RepID=UPI00265B4D49|nr:zinc transporter 2-like isoform X2 [Magnolia sinica]